MKPTTFSGFVVSSFAIALNVFKEIYATRDSKDVLTEVKITIEKRIIIVQVNFIYDQMQKIAEMGKCLFFVLLD